MPKIRVEQGKASLPYKWRILAATLVILWPVNLNVVFPRTIPQDEDVRDIKPTSWYKNRPKSRKSSSPSILYKRVTPRLKASPKTVVAEVGITIWRLRPSNSDDDKEVRETIPGDDIKDIEWTPERLDSITPMEEGEHIRLGIETPFTGHLYVINRARYADGTMGTPYLIFPTLRTVDSDNKVRPGRVIEVPGHRDPVPYFKLRRSKSSGGAEEVSEEVILLITTRPLAGINLETRRKALPANLVAMWEKQSKGGVEQWELVGGKGKAYTKAEKAAADQNRELVQDDPYPQTIYRVAYRTGRPIMLSVQLPILKN